MLLIAKARFVTPFSMHPSPIISPVKYPFNSELFMRYTPITLHLRFELVVELSRHIAGSAADSFLFQQFTINYFERFPSSPAQKVTGIGPSVMEFIHLAEQVISFNIVPE